MKQTDLNLVFPRSHTLMPDTVADQLRQLGVHASDLATAKSHSIHDGIDEVALIVRAGGLIALYDFTRSAIRIYDHNACPLHSVTMES